MRRPKNKKKKKQTKKKKNGQGSSDPSDSKLREGGEKN